ncbi:MAG: condensation domain-containing protein, partial [Acidobacteriota bacterium]
MSAWQLLSELDRKGVSIWADGGDLRFRAPKGALTPQLRSRLSRCKSEILSLLRQKAEPDGPQLPTLRPAPAQELHRPFPLTDLQQAYWVGFSGVFELGNVAPHAYIEFDLEGIDLEGLERAWQTLIERHDMLRAVLLPEGRQRILEKVPPYQISQHDLRQADEKEARGRMLEARREMCQKGPALYEWPLFEMRAFRLTDERSRLLWSLSLLICDDWSFHVLCQEWFRVYRQPEAELPAMQISFRDYVLALQAFEESQAYRQSLEYWRQRAVDLPPAPQLPLACEPSQIGAPQFERRSRSIERQRWRKFKVRAQQAGVTPSAALLAAYCEVLAAWSKQRRFALNLLFFNRPPLHPQVEKLVGNFSSTLLLEADCTGRLPFAERAKRLQQELWRNLEHSRVSGIRVLREMGKARKGDSRAAVPVVFASNLNTGLNQSAADQPPSESRAVRSVYSHLQTSHVWLDHQAFEINGALQFNWDAVEGLFPAGFAEQTYNAYCRLLDRLIEQDQAWQQPVGCLTPEDHLKLWDQVNATQGVLPEALLHELFERQVKRQPDRTAILDSRCTLTYRQVAMRARQLGKELRRRGARPNALVAVVLSKGWEQVVAVLAVLNAGAAYLPVSPSLPAERFRYLLENSGVELALTRSEQGPELPWPSGVSYLAVDGPGTVGSWQLAVGSSERRDQESGIRGQESGEPRGSVRTSQFAVRRSETGSSASGPEPGTRTLHPLSAFPHPPATRPLTCDLPTANCQLSYVIYTS